MIGQTANLTSRYFFLLDLYFTTEFLVKRVSFSHGFCFEFDFIFFEKRAGLTYFVCWTFLENSPKKLRLLCNLTFSFISKIMQASLGPKIKTS